MNSKEWTKRLQKALGLTEDGIHGPVTDAKSDLYDITIAVKTKPVEVIKPLPSGDYFGAPWIAVDLDLLGRNETDKELNRRYVPEWAKVGLPHYKTLVGNTYAWCAIRILKALRQVGINVKGLDAAAASSSRFGKKCLFWFGALLDIQHINKNGMPSGRHTCFFLYWIDETKRICATLDGNRGNLFCVARTNLSGAPGCDRLVTGPRWPKEHPDGQLVSMADVLAKYPHLKVGSVGSGTR